jgi:thioredoxin reductase (NADPH)
MYVRKGSLKGVEEMRKNSLLEKSNVKIFYNTAVQEIKGDESKVTHVVLKSGDKAPINASLNGLFLAIGSTPNTSILKGILKLDDKGYIALQQGQQTSIEGVYAIGDIVDPIYKQAVSAAGDGAKAALQAQKYVSEKPVVVAKAPRPETKTRFTPVLAEVIEVLSSEQFEKELASGVPVVVDFYATWCGPCKRISPMLENSASHLSGKVKFLKVNVDKLSSLTSSYQITSMPTVILFDPEGNMVERKVGTGEISDLLKRLQNE